MMIDTHCHLLKKNYPDIDDVVNKMGNNIIIVSGDNTETNHEVMELINKYENVYGTLGIHPEEANNYTDNDIKYIEDNINNQKIIGIGEIGLDYYWIKDNKEKQKELFIKQIELANKYNKTIVIHSRESILDTYEILKKYMRTKAVLHAYSSSLEMAYRFKKMNIIFGIGGVLTFKNSNKLKEVVENLDLSNFVLETDSPYLTPEPYRGHRNEPYNIIYVAKKIADIKGISLDEVLSSTTENAINQFDLSTKLC